MSDGEVKPGRCCNTRARSASGLKDPQDFVGVHHFGFQVDDLKERAEGRSRRPAASFFFDLGEEGDEGFRAQVQGSRRHHLRHQRHRLDDDVEQGSGSGHRARRLAPAAQRSPTPGAAIPWLVPSRRRGSHEFLGGLDLLRCHAVSRQGVEAALVPTPRRPRRRQRVIDEGPGRGFAGMPTPRSHKVGIGELCSRVLLSIAACRKYPAARGRIGPAGRHRALR